MTSDASDTSTEIKTDPSLASPFGTPSQAFTNKNKFVHSPQFHQDHSTLVLVDGKAQTMDSVIGLVNSLRREIAMRSEQVAWFETELLRMRRLLSERDRDVDQLKSVLDQKLSSPRLLTDRHAVDISQEASTDIEGATSDGGFGITSSSKPEISALTRVKKQGVSGESVVLQRTTGLVHHEKDDSSKQLIHEAIIHNDFLKHLELSQIKEIVGCMYEKRVEKGCYIIREGEHGDALYVTAEGILEVSKNNIILGRMDVGRAFGEMALLYNCNRTASVKATTYSRFWMLDRHTYQQIMMFSTVHKHEENLKFLLSVPVFAALSKKKLHKLVDVLEQLNYAPDECIIRQGEVGQTFFIIKSGKVRVLQSALPGGETREIRQLSTGEWFGERALYTSEKRSATVIAMEPGVNLLCLDRSDFIHLIGDLNEIKSKEYADAPKKLSMSSFIDSEDLSGSSEDSKKTHFADAISRICAVQKKEKLTEIAFQDLYRVAILGNGGFGRVELVIWKHDESKSFALKCMKKQHIVETRQQAHIFSERNLMFEISNKFVCKLYATYRDPKYVYMLLEACLGGELWTLLRNRGNFDDNITRFVIASVLEAFTYLHTRGIVYRDLKPENLLLDNKGYIKLCDFGFAKKIGIGRKTWTFCGTPEYVAPEIILNKGHDHSVDYWSLGILVYELLTGSPPFYGMDPMKIYNMILRGFDAIMFPPFKISNTASILIHRLCALNPVERLGYGRGGIIDIKQHKYFQGFDWIGLHRGTLAAPIQPKVNGPTDISNFDHYPDVVDVPPNELSGWDIDF